MSKAAYAWRECRFCGRNLAVAGLAQYNHLAGHYRRTFKGRPVPNTTLLLERALRTAAVIK